MAIVIGSTSAGTLGTVTLGEVKTLIQAHGYGTDTSAIQTTAIRAALRSFYGQRRWKFLRMVNTAFSATVANDGLVDISTLGRGIMLDSVRVNLGTIEYDDLRYEGGVELERARWESREPGFPTHWARSADTIKVWPR